MVIAPLIISIAMVAGFFYYETRIPPETAAVYVSFSMISLATAYRVISRIQTSANVVPTQLQRSLRHRALPVSMVEHDLYAHYRRLADDLPLVGHFRRAPHVRPMFSCPPLLHMLTLQPF